MTLRAVGAPLNLEQRLKSKPRRVEVLSWVEACGVRRTDLHVVDGAPISLLEPF